MNRTALEEVVQQVKRRIAQGDCPSIPAFRVSTLEEVIFDLAAENQDLRSQADASAKQRIAELEAALLRYGHHDLGKCEFMKHSARPCTCGFDAVLLREIDRLRANQKD